MPTPSKKPKKKDPSYGRVGGNRYPVERKMHFLIPGSSAGTGFLFDVAKGLSAINHRLYRQMKVYRVRVELANFTSLDANNAWMIQTVPDTWYVKKACELAFAEREEQLSKVNRPRGRWDDFRVGWSSSLKSGLAPLQADGSTTYTIDESQISKMHDATDSVDNEFVVYGAARDTSNNCWGIIEQYDLTGNTLVGPGADGTGAYVNAEADAGLEEAAGDLKAFQGNTAPYDMDSFAGATDAGSTMQGQIGVSADELQKLRSMTFDAPLGLLKVTPNTNIAQVLTVTVLPGNYKGVKALDW